MDFISAAAWLDEHEGDETMNMHSKYDWIAHYKAVQRRIALAAKKEVQPARFRLAATRYDEPIGPPRVVFVTPLPEKPRPPASARKIMAEVAREFNVSMDDLTGQRRFSTLTAPRMKTYYRLKEETKLSLPQIGKLLGGRDHTTVLYGYRKFKRMLEAGEVEI